MGSAHRALKWLELKEILSSPIALSFFENKGGIVVDNHDDMESPIREVGWYRKQGMHHDMHTDGEHHHDMHTDGEYHHDMYIGVEFKFESVMLFPPSELVRFHSLDSLVVHHL